MFFSSFYLNLLSYLQFYQKNIKTSKKIKIVNFNLTEYSFNLFLFFFSFYSCVCALPLQPLLLIRDLGLESFHFNLLTAFQEILKLGLESNQNGIGQRDTKFTVKNTTDVYFYSNNKNESALEQLRKARTKSFHSYVQALLFHHGDDEISTSTSTSTSSINGSILDFSLPKDLTKELTLKECTFIVYVRHAVCRLVLCVLYEPVHQVLALTLPVTQALSRSGYTNSLSLPLSLPFLPAFLREQCEGKGFPDACNDTTFTLLHSVYW